MVLGGRKDTARALTMTLGSPFLIAGASLWPGSPAQLLPSQDRSRRTRLSAPGDVGIARSPLAGRSASVAKVRAPGGRPGTAREWNDGAELPAALAWMSAGARRVTPSPRASGPGSP